VGRESRWLKEDGGEPKVMIEGTGLATATVASMVRLWAREVIKNLGEFDEARDEGKGRCRQGPRDGEGEGYKTVRAVEEWC
jgi:hypothetical protein